MADTNPTPTPTPAPHLIPDWHLIWTKFSFWGYVFVISLPNLYELAVQQGFFSMETVPEKFKWLVRIAGIVGIYLRLVNQTVKAMEEAQEKTAS